MVYIAEEIVRCEIGVTQFFDPCGPYERYEHIRLHVFNVYRAIAEAWE